MTAISEIMTAEPIIIEPHEPVKVAFQRMEKHKIRHLPVVTRGTLVGILSDRDIRRCLPPVEGELAEMELALRLLEQPVRNHMTEAVKSLTPAATVARAVDVMVENRIGCLPIIDADSRSLLGVVTYFDLLKFLRPRAQD